MLARPLQIPVNRLLLGGEKTIPIDKLIHLREELLAGRREHKDKFEQSNFAQNIRSVSVDDIAQIDQRYSSIGLFQLTTMALTLPTSEFTHFYRYISDSIDCLSVTDDPQLDEFTHFDNVQKSDKYLSCGPEIDLLNHNVLQPDLARKLYFAGTRKGYLVYGVGGPRIVVSHPFRGFGASGFYDVFSNTLDIVTSLNVRGAWDALRAAVEKHECGVCRSGPTRGHFPDDHRLSLSLAPKASMSADLVIFIGQYLMPTPTDYRLSPDVKSIRVHPFQEDLGRNWPLDLGIVSDEAEFLEALVERLPPKKRPQWTTEIAAARQAYQKQMDDHYALGLKYSLSTNRLHPAVIGRELYHFFYGGKLDPKQTINVWGGLTNLRFVPPYMRANRPGQGICSYYQSGTIGSEINHGIGAAAAAKEGFGIQSAYKGAPTLVVTSDGALAYSLMDLDTAAKYRLPLIVVIYNNNCWGTYLTADVSSRALQMYLFQENLRYDKAAEALGCHGEYVQTPEELRAAIAQAYEIAEKESSPVLINAQAIKEFSSSTQYPPGIGIDSGPLIGAISH